MPASRRAFNLENILSSIGAYGFGVAGDGQGKRSRARCSRKKSAARECGAIKPSGLRRRRCCSWPGRASRLEGFLPIALRTKTDRYRPTRPRSRATSSNAHRNYDKEWKEIENSGSDDRLQITNSMALMADRDTAIEVYAGTSPEHLKRPQRQHRSPPRCAATRSASPGRTGNHRLEHEI